MPIKARHKSDKYPGVYYTIGKRLDARGEEKIFYIVFKKDGKTHEEKAGRQFADAMSESKAAHIRSERIRGIRASNKEVRAERTASKESSVLTLGNLWDFFYTMRSSAGASKNGLNVDRCNYSRYLSGMIDREIDKITTIDVINLKKNLHEQGKSPQTVKHVLGLLRRIIRYGANNGICSIPDPSKLFFDMPKVDNQRTENLTTEQLSRLLTALDEESDQDSAAFIRLALATGMRKGAIIGLRWEDIDFERGFIVLDGESAKNDKTSQIPMNDTARMILERLTHKESPYIFPGRNGGKRSDFRRMARRVRIKAGLPIDFRPLHGLRHTFASYLASSGEVSLYTIQKLLTHSNHKTTQRYAHLTDDVMLKASKVASQMFISPRKMGENGSKDF